MPHMFRQLFEEEEDEPNMLAPDGPETEEAHKEDGHPCLEPLVGTSHRLR